jgi:CDP-diacylglycerol--glycerol-3-phosphate 3-phosphatidyltransferase/cardiolipin synthase
METAAATPESIKAVSLPNVLTYLRILAVPLVAMCLFLIPGDAGRWWALGVYVAACITDWLDGYLARAWRQQSMLGRMLDPIADKLLVGTTLLMLVHDNTIDRVHVAAAVIILSREILVSGLREFLAELNVKVHVTQLAKWKTMLQMVALGILLAGPAGDKLAAGVSTAGLSLLWVAALLTLWTGYDYLKAAVSTAMKR